ncbi:MAG: hypothetical protein Q7R66_16595 [Undibacterium sp.]|uniref:hypothetical protein n=1 Tax=Undibacterium sp. TaxID=1914977 RepID=UPI00272934F8|nr:hypothetical protein [Undibacterium sp.]MDO8653800.1 hypothetical protein [Undibacterium sp.]
MNFLSFFRFSVIKTLLIVCFFINSSIGMAQIISPQPKNSSALDEMLPDMIAADTLDKVLALFKPPVAKGQLLKSDYLLLDSPPIAAAGIITVHLMSELPGTEFFLLFNSAPSKDEPSFLTAQAVPNLTKADTRVKIKLTKSTELTMIVRAGGRWYSVTNDVKIVTK